jgi:hypothetical protein
VRSRKLQVYECFARGPRSLHDVRASQGEVISIVGATMLARGDVLDVKAQFGELLRQSAIFAEIGVRTS